MYNYICKYDKNFLYEEVKELFEKHKSILGYECDFNEFLKIYEWTVAVMHKNVFIGVLFVDDWQKDHCFISGFAKSKQAQHTYRSLSDYCDYLLKEFNFKYILSKTDIKSAIYCLLKAGFKHDKERIYKYYGKKQTRNSESGNIKL